MTSVMDGHVVMAFIGNTATHALFTPGWLGYNKAQNLYLAAVSNQNVGEWVIMASHTKERGLTIDFVGKTNLPQGLNDSYDNARAFSSELTKAMNSYSGEASCMGNVFNRAMKLAAESDRGNHAADAPESSSKVSIEIKTLIGHINLSASNDSETQESLSQMVKDSLKAAIDSTKTIN